MIPISEVAAKDEFLGIKDATCDDILAAHRVPPQLLGIVPKNTGSFGDVQKAADVFMRNEIEPLQRRFEELNDWIGERVVRFDVHPTREWTAPTISGVFFIPARDYAIFHIDSKSELPLSHLTILPNFFGLCLQNFSINSFRATEGVSQLLLSLPYPIATVNYGVDNFSVDVLSLK